MQRTSTTPTGETTTSTRATNHPNLPAPPRPRQLPGPLATLSARDRELFVRFGYGRTESVGHSHIHHAFEYWATVTPDAVAVEHGDETITYRELDRRADQLAARLAASGVRAGDRVALFARRSIPMMVGLIATLKSGAAYVPQHVDSVPAAQLQHVIETAETRVVLTLAATAKRIPVPDGHVVIALDELVAEPAERTVRRFIPTTPLQTDDPCYVLFTSGSTGRPNGVVVTHRNICNILLTAPGDLGIRPGWRVGQILNIAFDMAAWEILGALSHGATLVIRGPDIAETMSRVDVIIATPTVLSRIDPRRCHQVKVVAVAGEPCPRALADTWSAVCSFYNSCGPTETTIVNTMSRHHPAAERLTIGRPTPNNTVYVLDADLRPCPIGTVGEMWAGGDCVSTGYLGNPQLTAERYALDPFLGGGNRMFRTRDLARWTPDGELEHFGRTDDQVKVRGFRVELDSVSAILEAVPGCTRAATIKLNDRTLVSFVAPTQVDPGLARMAVSEALPYYCVPETVHTLSELPMTSRGKIDKTALRRLATAREREATR
ncbi:amino acid adenylation domain-containing protein [Salinispora tropica]|uniref:Amino acid adenylation domain n=1 Tax=Salinispora tropica (strain ATCC BAA-916 / DSM 44818 / JCM 13857 / NBRC 105044 / CNB-440) TaxID=369723 RepID=A4X303_SALTO|nr:amino acid adenylation domain-containing protein [Salinispora tropica]ABP53253.1 amino acid adenylation domain [Salinispora tropica CNB-440]